MKNPIIENIYQGRLNYDSHADMVPHMPRLREMAKECQTIVEFGVRSGSSTVSFLCGLPERGKLISYDINACRLFSTAQWEFIQADTGSPDLEMPECDLLFIDTYHTYAQITKEFRHGNRAKKWIVIHDTKIHEFTGEDGNSPGIWTAVQEFVAANPHWTIKHRFTEDPWGLTVLERV